MKAIKLFKKLGYEKTVMSSTYFFYESKETETHISFIMSEKGNRVHIWKTGDSYQDSGMNTYAELKAILKQIKELGWKDDTKEQMKWFKELKEDDQKLISTF